MVRNMMAQCECYAHVLQHVQIADLANIIHEYVSAELRRDQNIIKFNDKHGVFSIEFSKHPMPMMWASNCNEIKFFNFIIFITDPKRTNLCSEIFHCHEVAQLDGYFHTCPYSERENFKKILAENIQTAHEIITAEETGGHLHPDPRII